MTAVLGQETALRGLRHVTHSCVLNILNMWKDGEGLQNTAWEDQRHIPKFRTKRKGIRFRSKKWFRSVQLNSGNPRLLHSSPPAFMGNWREGKMFSLMIFHLNKYSLSLWIWKASTLSGLWPSLYYSLSLFWKGNNPNFNQISSSNNLFGVKREKLENNFIYLAIGIQQINHACMKKFEYKVK